MTIEHAVQILAEKRQAAFERLALDQANGDAIDPEQAASVLEMAGKTIADLDAAVKAITDRRAAAKTIASAGDIEKERCQVDRELAKVEAKLAAAQAEYARASGPLIARVEQLKRREQDVQRARKHLHATARPEIKTELQDVARRQRELHDELKIARSDVERFQAELEAYEKKLTDLPTVLQEPDKLLYQQQAADFRERVGGSIARAQTKVESLIEEQKSLAARVAELNQEAMVVL